MVNLTANQIETAKSVLMQPEKYNSKYRSLGNWQRGCGHDMRAFTDEERATFIKSGYLWHYKDGDNDYRNEIYPYNASVGDIVGDMICIRAYCTKPEHRASEGKTIESTWCKINFVLANISKFKKAVQAHYEYWAD